MKKFYRALAALVITAFLWAAAPHAKAAETLEQPTFTYGESLNPDQLNETRKLLRVTEGSAEIPVQINELNTLLQDTYPYYQAYSSTYIVPASKGSGIAVDIITPDTITAITPHQYENAAITAGAVDVTIFVASAVPVDGSGALAGVYKAFNATGRPLDQKAVNVAQQELETTEQINKDNAEKPGYKKEDLSAAVTEIKQQVQDAKDQNGGRIDHNQIEVIINNVINEYHLDDLLSDENRKQLADLSQQFSEIELSDEQKQALGNLGERLKAAGDQIAQQARDTWDSLDEEQKGKVTGIWNSIVQFFQDLVQGIVNIFSGNNN